IEVDVRKPAVHRAAPADLVERALAGPPHSGVESGPAVPRYRRLERAGHHADAQRDTTALWNEGIPPCADRTLATGRPPLARYSDVIIVDEAAFAARDLDGLAHRPLLRHLGRLEADDEQRGR